MPLVRHASSAAALGLVMLVSGCGGDAPDPGAGQAQAQDVTAITVQARDTPVVFEFVGKTQSSRRVEIFSRVEGFLEERLYTEGELVEAGTPLFKMDQKPFQAALDAAEAELSQQQARLATATANYRRVKPLAAKGAVPQKELDDAEGSYRAAKAAVEAAKANVVQAELDLGYTIIYSPVTGATSFANKREGAYIGIGTDSLLTYVAQLDPMWVEFSISENQILRSRKERARGVIKMPEEGAYEVEIVLGDGTVYPHTGEITFADVTLSEETGTFLIRAEVANPEFALRPGQFVRARLKGAVRPDAIVVPIKAVQQGAKGSFVWVVDPQGKAELRPIQVGPWIDKDWVVEQGLQAGETVVVDGALRLRAGVPVKVVETEAEPSEEAEAAQTQGAAG